MHSSTGSIGLSALPKPPRPFMHDALSSLLSFDLSVPVEVGP